MHLVSGEGFDGGHAALVDQPVVIAEHCRPRSTGVGTARRHLVGAQVGPVGEVGMPAVRHSAGHREIDQHHVEQTNHHRDHPANPSRGAMVGVAAHHRGAAGEFDQWKYRKRNTERQHHL
ncbi:Uncharacterised protein [Mycobacterium tuberculosis]|nr:Uncharacterised protein [Mycobacterium tuberculosis]